MTVYEHVTSRIITFIEEKKTLPWRKPWAVTQSETPQKNLSSGHEYQGINMILTGMAGYGSPYWLTMRQAAKMGGRVKDGEAKAYTPVVIWNPDSRSKKKDEGEESTEGEEGKEKKRSFKGFYGMACIYNVEQCEGIEYPKVEATTQGTFNPIEKAEGVVKAMPKVPPIFHNGTGCSYSTMLDRVMMPPPGSFLTPDGLVSPEDYYSALFHELAHSTGHENRLRRFKDEQDDHMFGSKSYSKEELVAEMASSFILNELGIVTQNVERNSQAYIAGWLKKLNSDPRFIVEAAPKAVKAANYIFGRLA